MQKYFKKMKTLIFGGIEVSLFWARSSVLRLLDKVHKASGNWNQLASVLCNYSCNNITKLETIRIALNLTTKVQVDGNYGT